MEVGGRSTDSPLTARERQVASLIGLGLTNRQIGKRLGISERTVGAHVQNILNKLGANNRAQIASWSARGSLNAISINSASLPAVARPEPANVAPVAATATRPARGRLLSVTAVAVFAILLIRSDQVVSPSSAATRMHVALGPLAYQAELNGSGAGFSIRYTLGDPDSSDIRFVKGAIEYSVLKPGGNTGHTLAMPPLPGYFAELELSVKPGSDVTFWFVLETVDGSTPPGQHLVYIRTHAEAMQLAYFIGGDTEYLGPQVPIRGLQTGRTFTISTLVSPPRFEVSLDGASVIKVRHQPSPPRLVPSFAIFSDGTGMVRVSAIRVYALT